MSGTSMAYGVLCLLSMMLAAGCYYRTTYREFRLQLVFVAVLAVNTGYFMLSISKTLEGALMANSLAYLGSAALQPAMLLTVMDMCKVRPKREKLFIAALLIIGAAVFVLASSGGISTLYYEEVSLTFVKGTSMLQKEYGPLHFLYTVYVVAYFIAMSTVILVSSAKKQIGELKHAAFMLATVLLNILVWVAEKFADEEFEFLSVSYVAAEMLLFIIYSAVRGHNSLESGQKTRNTNIVCLTMVFLASVVRIIIKNDETFSTMISSNCIVYALFTAALFLWIWQIKRKILQDTVRRNLIAAGLLMIFWMAIRTIKYDFLLSGWIACRYIWYLYYIPMIFIPLLMFLSVLHIGLSYDSTISRRWDLLFIPSGLLVLAVLTNDLHQQAFRFIFGLEAWDEVNIVRGPVYYAVMTWMAVLFIATLVVAFARCSVAAQRRKIWIPAIPLVIGLVYTILVVTGSENLLLEMFLVPEMGCLLFASFMEILICLGFLPSNDYYGVLWNASSIGAGIIERDGTVRYRAARSVDASLQQVRDAAAEAVLLDDGNISLVSIHVKGGYGYWTRDITEINRLNREIENLGDVIAEENTMLEAENRIKEKLMRIKEQNRLYDHISETVKPQLDTINSILDNLSQEEEEFEMTMKYACILNSYIKRHSNLLLLQKQNGALFGSELRRAVAESMEYVKLYGIKTLFSCRDEGACDGKAALTAYEVFEGILEKTIPGASHMLVFLDICTDGLYLKMEIEIPDAMSDEVPGGMSDGLSAGRIPPDFMASKLAASGGSLETERDGATEYVSLALPRETKNCGGGEVR